MRGVGNSDVSVQKSTSPRTFIEKNLVTSGGWVFVTIPEAKSAIWSSQGGLKKQQDFLSDIIQGARSNRNHRKKQEGRKRYTTSWDQGAGYKSRVTKYSEHDGRMNCKSRKKCIGMCEGDFVLQTKKG